MFGWDCPQTLRSARRLACAVVLCAAARGMGSDAPPATRPATAPATQPATAPSAAERHVSQPLPKEYDLLLTRSIFARGRGPRAGPDAAAAAARAQGPRDGGVVLRGVADQAGQRTALLEDTASGKTSQLHVGDDASGGRIVAITMDGLDRSLGGHLLHVAIGQSLDGKGDAPGPATRQSIAREDAPRVAPASEPEGAIPAAVKIGEMK